MRILITVKYLAIQVLLVTLLLGLLGVNARADDLLENWLVEKAIAEMGFSQDTVEPGDVQRIIFPLSDLTIYQVKLVDKETGQTYASVMDETGATRSIEYARQAEGAAHDTRLAQLLAQDSDLSVDDAMAKLVEAPHGRLNSDLFGQLESMYSAETLTVAIWLRADNVAPLERFDLGHQPAAVETGDAPLASRVLSPDIKPVQKQEEENLESAGLADRVEAIRGDQEELRLEIDDFRQKNMNHLQSQIGAIKSPLVADLGIMGFEPKYVSPVSPLVYIELPKSVILEMVLKAYVDTIYGPNVGQDDLSNAKPTQKADIVDNWFGFDGTGIDVAHTEDSRADWPHTSLITGTTRVPGDFNVDSHATACTGIVASQHATHQGIAQGPNMFSANGTSYDDADMAAAMDWAVITENVDVMNNSYSLGGRFSTSLNDHDRHLDYLARNYSCTVIKSAGNDGVDPDHNVSSPGKGYNVITVGAYNDNNSLTWDDDTMYSGSSYNDPETGCEKPEVVASGSNITSTLTGNAVANAGTGTSFSAPMVAGEAALLMDRNSTLGFWPESVKAIIMATALHNIEGATRLSEKDGAGGVDMRAAFRVVDEGWWAGRSLVESDLPLTYNVYAFAGQTIRAAIAWDSNPNSSYTTDPLEADLDLRLKNPSGTIVATSSSGSNSFEIVEYTATTTGTYTIEAYLWSWSGTNSTYLGVAWWPGHRVLGTPIQSMGTPPIARDYFQLSSNYAYWNVVGIRSPSASNYNIYMYDGSAFGDPDDYGWLEDSTLSSAIVDYVVIDRNHAPFGTYNVEVRAVSGSGTYPIQWWNPAGAVSDGTYPATITTAFVLKAVDVYLTAGTTKYFAIKTVSGNADLGMALHDSTVGTSTTYYQGRSNRVVQSDTTGAGGDESMTYLTSTSDDMGLIVWNNGSTVTTAFNLYVDSTAATGSIVINGGDGYTGSTAVTLALSATDSQTGVAEMRFSNTGDPWSAWEPYATTKSWTLPSGDGSKYVWVQFKNNAGMISGQYSDSISLDTSVPTGTIVINSGAVYTPSTSVTLTLSANDTGSGVADMRIGNSGGTWEPWEPYTTNKAWDLIPGAGSKSVWVQFRDNAGNISIQYGDSIILVVDPPVIDDIDFDACISECPTCPDSHIVVAAHDPASGSLSYAWTVLNGGTVSPTTGAVVNFDPPDSGPHPCPYNVRVQVTSSVSGLTTTQIVPIRVKLTGDVDANGVVNILDKVAVRNGFGSSGSNPADVNCDNVVNILDKVVVRNQFGQSGCGCP